MIRFACPKCRAILEQPDAVAGLKCNCPVCNQRLQVPHVPANQTVMGDLLSSKPPVGTGEETSAYPPPPPPLPYVTSHTEPPRGGRQAEAPSPPPPPRPDAAPRSRRRARDDDDDDYDDDFPSIARRGGSRQSRYSREIAAKAATSGLICSLCSMGLLVLTFVLWFLVAQNRRGRFGQGEPLVVVILLVILGSFVLGLLGIVFSSRGLDNSNNHNRGQATAGLVCGIIALVIGSIVGLFFLCIGMFLFSAPF